MLANPTLNLLKTIAEVISQRILSDIADRVQVEFLQTFVLNNLTSRRPLLSCVGVA